MGLRSLEIRGFRQYSQGSEVTMSDTELLMKEIEGLPADALAQIAAFVDQLTHKAPPAERPLHTVKLFPDRKPHMTPQEALDRMCGMFADAKFSVDDLLEERRRDLEREKE
jgi:hypothetical protein